MHLWKKEKKSEAAGGDFCPLIKAACMKDACKFWTHIRGQDPQSKAELDFPDCAVSWLPTLLLENSKETRQGAAAIESFRNESVKGNEALFNLIFNASTGRLLPPVPPGGNPPSEKDIGGG